MNAERLLVYYERIADAADAIARLRRFILDLAVRGKLLEGNDKPWTELPIEKCLERLPDGRFIHQGWSPQCESYPSQGENVWGVLKTTAIQDGHFLSEQNKELPYNLEPRPQLEVQSGDILITCAGPRARCGIACLVSNTRGRLMISGKMYRFRANPTILVSSYLALFLRSDDAQSAVNTMKTGSSESGMNLTQDRFKQLRVAFGSIAEQHRIVVKVDELMALCNRLEAARAEREAMRDRLAVASLGRLNAPDPETFHDDARFALDVLPALTTRPDQIKQLRQTILNLAVRGNLVPQASQDEPSAELLKRFAKAKAEQRKKTGDARIKIELDPKVDDLPMALPWGWAVQSFENLFLFIDYRGNTPPKTDEGIPLITAKNIRMGYLNREPREYISKATFKTWMTRGFPEIGDLFFTTEAPLANICLNDIEEPFALAQRAICFQPYATIDTKFLMFALMSDVMQSLIDKHATGMTAKGIKAANLKPLPIPIPPLAEQHRIVDKVAELMALCDRLEAGLTATAATRRLLLDALLHEALAPADTAKREAAE